MCKQIVIWFLVFSAFCGRNAFAAPYSKTISVEIFGDILTLPVDESLYIEYQGPISEESLWDFHQNISRACSEPLVAALQQYRAEKQLNDWLYYQLVRRTAQQLAPKEENYYRYTLYKWFLLVRSGFDATLGIYNDQLLFYVYSHDEVYNIPLYKKDGKQYVCLNIHDYMRASQDFKAIVSMVDLPEADAVRPFSYTVSRRPDFNPDQYREQDLRFPYANKEYHFKLKVNPQVQNIFANYPVVDYGTYFNIPVSKYTYQSLVPGLKQQMKRLNTKNGVEYLMKFTRNAFLYEDDRLSFGKEKRMGPEETLLSFSSDCDDRAALFFFLVKEIYDLPMIALLYEDHITIAVHFKKGYGKTITHNGIEYSICEPTPQSTDLSIGRIAENYRHQPYTVVYSYLPHK